MKRNLTLKINEYKRKFNNALKFRTKFIEERKKHSASQASVRSAFREALDRLKDIRKMRSCTNPKCKDALLDQIRRTHSNDMAEKNALHCLNDEREKYKCLETTYIALKIDNAKLRE